MKNKSKKRPEHSKRMKGIGNPNYKDGRSLKKYYCKDCGKKITWQTAIYGNRNCGSCSQQKKELTKLTKQKIRQSLLKLKLRGKNSPNYKNGKIKCIDCKKELTTYDKKIKRCKKCSGKNFSKKFSGKDSFLFGRKGKNSNGYKHGKTLKKYYCIDCKKELKGFSVYKYKKKICKDCYLLTLIGKGNPNFGNHKLSGKNNPRYGKIAHHGNGDYYKKIYMRSSYEIKFAYFLDLSGYQYLYEPKVFNLGNFTYTPDFYIPEWNYYIEIKGWWRNKDRMKFKLFKKLYPKLRIKVLMKPELQELGILK